MPLSDVTAADIGADGRWIAVGNAKGSIKVWDNQGGARSPVSARSAPRGIS